MTLEQKIEAILFYRGEPVLMGELTKFVQAPKADVMKAVENLQNNSQQRGVRIVVLDDKVVMRAAPEMSELIFQIEKEERSRPLGKAGSETLAIVLYKGPVTRTQIDYIRGVNSTFILRNLLIRGLIERVPNPKDQRSFLYKPTLDLLAHLGVERIDELPDYKSIGAELAAFEQTVETARDSTDNI